MKLGTHIRMEDGREATVVYHGLEGDGVKWGLHYPDKEDFKNTTGGLLTDEVPDDWPWYPDALLREPWDSCESVGWTREQCVGSDFEVIS